MMRLTMEEAARLGQGGQERTEFARSKGEEWASIPDYSWMGQQLGVRALLRGRRALAHEVLCSTSLSQMATISRTTLSILLACHSHASCTLGDYSQLKLAAKLPPVFLNHGDQARSVLGP